MRILVIDDAEYNRASALLTLAGHDVLVVDNVSRAFKFLDGHRPRFDAVLTDLMMPIGNFRGAISKSATPPQMEIPAGLVFALKASNLGIRSVICSDSNHRLDWICALLDLLMDKHGSQKARMSDPAKRVAFVELGTVPMTAVWDDKQKAIVFDAGCWKQDVPRIKDWHEAMIESGLFPEIEPAPIRRESEVQRV